MNYVVGFIGSDGFLGRTFLTDAEGIKTALKELHEGNGEQFNEDSEWWDDGCTFEAKSGLYFIGSLETV